MSATTDPTPEQDLLARVQVLAALRRDTARYEADLAAARAEFDREHRQLLANVAECRAHDAAFEADLRARALAHLLATGDRTPAPGIGFRRAPRVAFDAGAVLAWARQVGCLEVLTLDSKALVKAAKEPATMLGAIVLASGLVAVEQDWTVTLASDLATALTTADTLARIAADGAPAPSAGAGLPVLNLALTAGDEP